MKNILAAIDFTEVTDVIIEKAVELAKIFEANLWIVHVAKPTSAQIGINLAAQDIPGLSSAGSSYYSELLNVEETRKRIADELREEHSKMLELTKKYSDTGVKVQGMLLEGVEVDRILEKAGQKEADLIVMGTHGHSLIRKAIVGSISEGVLKNSKVPVMLIPQH